MKEEFIIERIENSPRIRFQHKRGSGGYTLSQGVGESFEHYIVFLTKISRLKKEQLVEKINAALGTNHEIK